MAKIKVLDLAREVGMEDDKLVLKLKRMGAWGERSLSIGVQPTVPYR